MKHYNSLNDALDDLKERGYKVDFAIEATGIYCGDLDLRLNPEEFNVDEVYRFEANPNTGDNEVLYAISSSARVKGTLVDKYGAYGASLSFEMTRNFYKTIMQ